MIFYPRYMSDFNDKAGHLSLLEKGVYDALLDRYYLDEKPIPDAMVYRWLRATSDAEKEAVDTVLGEFFELRDGHWYNSRCDEVIAEYHAKGEKAAASANARWNKDVEPKTGTNASSEECERNANALRPHSEGNANQNHNQNHIPELTNNNPPNPPPEKPRKRGPVVDHSEGIDPPPELALIPGFGDAWRARCAQRFSKSKTHFPTPDSVHAELAILCQCRDPIDVLRRATAGGWQGLNTDSKRDYGPRLIVHENDHPEGGRIRAL